MNEFNDLNERAGGEKTRKESPTRKKPRQIMAEALLSAERLSAILVQTTLFEELTKLDNHVTSLEWELKDRNDRLEKIIADLHDKLGEVNREKTLLRAKSADQSEKLQERRIEIYHLKEELAAAKAGTSDANEENSETISNKKSIALSALKNGDINDPQVSREIDDGLYQTDEIIDLTDEVSVSDEEVSSSAGEVAEAK